MKKVSTTVIAHDVHAPYQDKAAVRILLSVIKELQPQRILLLGDIFDCGQISRFATPADSITKLQEDVDEGTGFIADCRRVAPNAHIRLKMGNHEERLPKWAAANPALANMRFIKQPLKFFGLEKLIGPKDLIPYSGHIRIKDTIFTHGHRACKNSGATALANLQSYGYSTYCGHTHRMSRVHWTFGRRVLTGYEGGCLCELDAKYLPLGTANWQHGFAVAHEIQGYPRLQVNQIQIIDGQAWFNGRLYSA